MRSFLADETIVNKEESLQLELYVWKRFMNSWKQSLSFVWKKRNVEGRKSPEKVGERIFVFGEIEKGDEKEVRREKIACTAYHFWSFSIEKVGR